jgi:hypothetical protein
MSRVQCGDGAAGTDAEDEEHKQFSHASPSSLVGAFQSASKCSCTHSRQVACMLRGGYAARTAINAGSELLIFVLRIRWKDDPAETPGQGSVDPRAVVGVSANLK